MYHFIESVQSFFIPRLKRTEFYEQEQKEALPKPKTCLIDVGGGMRGIYAAGVLEKLMDDQIQVDFCIGVSAGSANLATYIAHQQGRLFAYYHDYASRQEYGSVQNFIKKRSYFDMDYIYGTLSNTGGEYPLDYQAIERSPIELITVATNALTGKPAYFTKERMDQDDYSLMKGSCSVPYLCTTNNIANVPYCDGTVSDPIPIQKALDLGADKIVVLFPRPVENDEPSKMMDLTLAMLAHGSQYGRTFPAVGQALKKRRDQNNASLKLALQLQKEGKLLFVYPETLHDVNSLGGSPESLQALYDEGYQDGSKAAEFLMQN